MRYILSLFEYSDKSLEIAIEPDPLIAWPASALPELALDDDGTAVSQLPRGKIARRRLATAG
jgi:hypothetical protein